MPTATLIPPAIDEVLPAVRELLNGDITLESMLGGSNRVFDPESNFNEEDVPDPDPTGFWARIVLMDIEKGLSNYPEQLDRVTGYEFQSRVDLMPSAASRDDYSVEKQFRLIHNRIFFLLELQTLSLTGSRQVSPIRRTRPQKRSMIDKAGYRYSSSKFSTVLAPN